MGQGGADEIFRVFTGVCPQVLLFPVHMEKEVYRMMRKRCVWRRMAQLFEMK